MRTTWNAPLVIIKLAVITSLAVVACSLPAILSADYARCFPPPDDFSESTLVGTWIAGVPEHNDVLVISADGTYRQQIHVRLAGGSSLDYESDPLPWHLEYSDEGIPYLHLSGYSFCGMNPDIPCDVIDGGGYDFCQDEWIPMEGEGILLVLATSATKPTREDPAYYYLHYPLGSENSYSYAPESIRSIP